jgi:hypothetical protein
LGTTTLDGLLADVSGLPDQRNHRIGKNGDPLRGRVDMVRELGCPCVIDPTPLPVHRVNAGLLRPFRHEEKELPHQISPLVIHGTVLSTVHQG